MSSQTKLGKVGKRQMTPQQTAFFTVRGLATVGKDEKIWKRHYTSSEWQHLEPQLIGRFSRHGLFEEFVDYKDLRPDVVTKLIPEATCPYVIEDGKAHAAKRVADAKDIVREMYDAQRAELDQNSDEYDARMQELAMHEEAELNARGKKFFSYYEKYEESKDKIADKRKEWCDKQNKTLAVFLETFELDQTRETMVINKQFRNVWHYLKTVNGGEKYGALQQTMSIMDGLANYEYVIGNTAETNFDFIESSCDKLQRILKFQIPDALRATFFLCGVNRSHAHRDLKSLVTMIQNNSLANSIESLSWDEVKVSFKTKVDTIEFNPKLTDKPGSNHSNQELHSAETDNNNNNNKRKREHANVAAPTNKSKEPTKWCDFCKKKGWHTIETCWAAQLCPHCKVEKHNWKTCKQNPDNTSDTPSKQFAKQHGVQSKRTK